MKKLSDSILVLCALMAAGACSPTSSPVDGTGTPQDAVEYNDSREDSRPSELVQHDTKPADGAVDTVADLVVPPADNTVEPDVTGTDVEPGTCSANGQCPDGQVCKNGACGPCTKASQCADGQGCKEGVCGPCAESAECGGELCEGGECVACTSNGECEIAYGAEWLCETGVCRRTTCTADADCSVAGQLCLETEYVCGDCESTLACLESQAYGPGYVCLDGVCVEGSCTPGLACGEGLVCSAAKTCLACTGNASCSTAYSSAYLCIDGTCQEAECNQQKQCTQGLVCDLYHFCRFCKSHDECPEGYVCDLGDQKRCYPGECTEATAQELCETHLCKEYACVPCDAETPCGPGRFCGEGGICYIGECASDLDCATMNPPVLCQAWVCATFSGGERACVAVPEAAGTPCNVEDKCAQNVCTVQSNCVPLSYTCDDALECTDDICNPVTGACSFSIKPFRCLLDGQCKMPGDPRLPEPPVCSQSQCESACSSQGALGAVCEPATQECLCTITVAKEQICTPGEPCGSAGPFGTSSGTCLDPYLCSMGQQFPFAWCEALAGICQSMCDSLGAIGVCSPGGETCECHAMDKGCDASACNSACVGGGFGSGACEDIGQCRCYHAVPPDLTCFVCEPNKSQTLWTANHLACGDGDPCTTDTCGGDGCSSQYVAENTCSIAGQCLSHGQPNPLDPCKVCDVFKTKTDWSAAPLGTKCGMCKECSASGQCVNENLTDKNKSCDACKYCSAGSCINVPHNQDPKSDCMAKDIGLCLENGNCRDGKCDIYDYEDSVNKVTDGENCTEDDHCENGEVVGYFDSPKTCQKVSPFGHYACNTSSETCTKCNSTSAPCPSGMKCCGGECMPDCCTDNDCSGDDVCGAWFISNPMGGGMYLYGCH